MSKPHRKSSAEEQFATLNSDLGKVSNEWRQWIVGAKHYQTMTTRHYYAATDYEMMEQDKGDFTPCGFDQIAEQHSRIARRYVVLRNDATAKARADAKRLYGGVTKDLMRERIRDLANTDRDEAMLGFKLAFAILKTFGCAATVEDVQPSHYASVFEACDFAVYEVATLDEITKHEGLPPNWKLNPLDDFDPTA